MPSVCGTCPPHAPYFRNGACRECSHSGSYYAVQHPNGMPQTDKKFGCRGYCGANTQWTCSRYNHGTSSHNIIERCPVGTIPNSTFDTVRRECGDVCPTTSGSGTCPTCPSYKPFYRKRSQSNVSGPLDQYFCTCCKQANSTAGSTCPAGGTCSDFVYKGKTCSDDYDCGAQNGYECVSGRCTECSTTWTFVNANNANTTTNLVIDHRNEATCGTCPPHAPFWRYDDHSHSGWPQFSGCVPCSAPKNSGTSYSWYYHTWPWNVAPYKTPDDYPGCRGICGYTWGGGVGNIWQCMQTNQGSNQSRCPVGMVDNRTGAWTKCDTVCSTANGAANVCNSCPPDKPYYRLKSTGEFFCSSCHTPSTPSVYCSDCDAEYVCNGCPPNFEPDAAGGCSCINHHACGEGSGLECVSGSCVPCSSTAVSGAHYSHEQLAEVKNSVCGSCPTHKPFYRVVGCTSCSNSNAYHANMYQNGMPVPEIVGCRGYCNGWNCQRYNNAYASYHALYRCPVGYNPPTPYDAVWRNCETECPTADNSAECGTCPSYKPFYRKKAEDKSTGPIDQYFCTCCKQANSLTGSTCPAGGTCIDFEYVGKECSEDYDCGSQNGYECFNGKCVECSTSWTFTNTYNIVIDHNNEKTCGTCPPHAPFWRYDDHSESGVAKFSGCVPCSAAKNATPSYGWYYYSFNHTSLTKSTDDHPGCRGMCGYQSGYPAQGGDFPASPWSCMQANTGGKEYRCPIGIVDERTTAWTKCGAVCDTSDGASSTCNSCPVTKPYYRIKSDGEYFCTSCHTPNTTSNFCGECNEDYECLACAENFTDDGAGGCKCANHHACGEGSGKQCIDGACVNCPSTVVCNGNHCHDNDPNVRASICPSCPPHAPYYRSGACRACSSYGSYYAVLHGSGMPQTDQPFGCRGYCGANQQWTCSRYNHGVASYHIIERCPVGTIPNTTFDAVRRECGAVCPTADNTNSCPTCPLHKPFYRKKTDDRSTGAIDQYFCTCCRQKNSTSGGACPAGGECVDFEWSKTCEDNYDCGAQSGFECVDGQCQECSVGWTYNNVSNPNVGTTIPVDHRNEKTCGTCPPHAPFFRYDDHSHSGWSQFSGCVPCAVAKNSTPSYGWYYHTWPWNTTPYKTPDDYPGCRGMCGYQSGYPANGGDFPSSPWACMQTTQGNNQARCPVGIVDERTAAWTPCGAICDTSDGEANICNSCPVTRPYYRVKPSGEYLCSSCHTPNTPSEQCGECDENYECLACPDDFVDDGNGGCKCANHHACKEGSGLQCDFDSGVCIPCPDTVICNGHHCHENDPNVLPSVCPTCPPYAPYYRSGACRSCSSYGSYYAVLHAQGGIPRPADTVGCRGYCGANYQWTCSRYNHGYPSHRIIERCPVGFYSPTPFDTVRRECDAMCPTDDGSAACGTCPPHKPFFRKKNHFRSTGPIDQYFCTCCKKANSTEDSACPEGGQCVDFEWSKTCTEHYDCGAGNGFECVGGTCVECDPNWSYNSNGDLIPSWTQVGNGGVINHFNEKTCGTCPPHAPFWRYDDHFDTDAGWPQFASCVPCAVPRNTGTSYHWHYYSFNNTLLYKSDDALPGCRGMCGYANYNPYPKSNWDCMQANSGGKEYRCPVGIVDERTTTWTKCGAVCSTEDGEANTCNSCPAHKPYYRIKQSGEYFCAECHTPGAQNGCPASDIKCDINYECNYAGATPDSCDVDSDCGPGFKCTGDPRYCALCTTAEACGACNCGSSEKPDGTGYCVRSNSCCTGPCNIASGANSCEYSDLACSGVQQCQTSGASAGYCCSSLMPYWQSNACKPCTGTSGHTGTCNTPGMMCNANYDCISCDASDSGCIECYTNSHCSGVRQCRSNNLCCPTDTPYWSGSTCVECLEHRHCASNICQAGECKTPDTVECGIDQIWHMGSCKYCPSGATPIGTSACDCGTQIWNSAENSCVDAVDRDEIETSTGDSVKVKRMPTLGSGSDRYSRIKDRMDKIYNLLRDNSGEK